VTFTPEENKHYEVYFGLFGEKCIIKVSEARQVYKKVTRGIVGEVSESTKQLISISDL